MAKKSNGGAGRVEAMKSDGGPVSVSTDTSKKQTGLQKAIGRIKSRVTSGRKAKAE